MSDKYVVSQEFMDELEEWKLHTVVGIFINDEDISKLPIINYDWWHYQDISNKESNNRLIAIIRWVNGEDVFEVKKPKKWVVRSKDASVGDRHLYVNLNISYGVKDTTTGWTKATATKFDTKEEAESWANSHQEVIEVDE